MVFRKHTKMNSLFLANTDSLESDKYFNDKRQKDKNWKSVLLVVWLKG